MRTRNFWLIITLILFFVVYLSYKKIENPLAICVTVGIAIFLLWRYSFKSKEHSSKVPSKVVEKEEDIDKLVNIYAEATRFPGHREYEGIASITEIKTGRKIEVQYISELFINKYDNPVNITFYFGKDTFCLKGILSDELFKTLPVQQMWIAHCLRFSISTSIILANMDANLEDMRDNINPILWVRRPNIGKAESSFSIEFEESLRNVIF